MENEDLLLKYELSMIDEDIGRAAVGLMGEIDNAFLLKRLMRVQALRRLNQIYLLLKNLPISESQANDSENRI